MRRASTFSAVLAVAGLLTLAHAAAAQSAAPTPGATQGLRYLSWQGRGEPVAAPQPNSALPVAARRDLRRPNTVIPHGGSEASVTPGQPGLSAAPVPARRTLTPANAWLRPTAPLSPETAPAPVVAPTSAVPSRAAPAGPEYLPDQGGRGQPAPAEVFNPTPTPAPVAEGPRFDASDPMAPRRDAPIFRMQQDRPPSPAATRDAAATPEVRPQPRRVAEVGNTGERPPQQGARYYSVHRQNGREPDPLTMPEPTYVDALVVTMTETPASQDLAQPEQGPTLIRDRNGNMRAAPAASDGDHQ